MRKKQKCEGPFRTSNNIIWQLKKALSCISDDIYKHTIWLRTQNRGHVVKMNNNVHDLIVQEWLNTLWGHSKVALSSWLCTFLLALFPLWLIQRSVIGSVWPVVVPPLNSPLPCFVIFSIYLTSCPTVLPCTSDFHSAIWQMFICLFHTRWANLCFRQQGDSSDIYSCQFVQDWCVTEVANDVWSIFICTSIDAESSRWCTFLKPEKRNKANRVKVYCDCKSDQ